MENFKFANRTRPFRLVQKSTIGHGMCASKLEIHFIFTAQRWVKKRLLGNVFPLNLFEDEGNNVGCQLGSVLKI